MSKFKEYLTLFKIRMTVFILVSVTFGFYYGKVSGSSHMPLLYALVGSAFLAFSCFGINQLLEIDRDSLMARTKNRPLVTGQLSRFEALAFSVLFFLLGVGLLWFKVNGISAFLGGFIVFSYCFLYTPTKKWTTINTFVGAVPGAIPPVLGWTAATGTIGNGAILLFLILFFWQMPHFLAIAWMHRADYAKGNFAMLSTVDISGEACFQQIVIQTVFLLLVSVLPLLWGMAGYFYLGAALVSGFYFLYKGIQLYRIRTEGSARSLFYFSLIYLPVILLCLILDSTSVYS